MRLGTLFTGSSVALAVFGVTTAVVLGWSTSELFRYADRLTGIIDSVTASEELQISILRHDRARRFFELDGHPEDRLEMEQEAEKIRQGLRAARQYVNTPVERVAHQEVERSVAAYMEAVQQGLPREERLPRFEAALDAAQEVARLNVSDAHEVRDRALTVNRIADLAGLISASLLILTIVVILLSVRLGVYTPLLQIRRALAAFRSGDKERRIPQRGVADLKEIAAEYNGMADGLVASERSRLQFLAGVAHDLRNPLHALKLGTALLRRSDGAKGDEKLQVGLQRTEKQVDHLNRMIGDLLDRSRIEAGNLELQLVRVDVRELCADVAELYRPTTEQHQVEVSCPDQPVLVDGDPVRLQQVLTNLVSNAIKYSPDGGQVRIEAERQEGWAVMRVTDQGMGVPPSEQERIFEPFRRSSRAVEGIPGVGLGLSVARRIIVAHGGRIELQSSPGAGSTFSVWLKRAEGEAPAAATPAEAGTTEGDR